MSGCFSPAYAPVEYQIRGINQIEIQPKGGLTFARGLRTILRSDPDVLLVGGFLARRGRKGNQGVARARLHASEAAAEICTSFEGGEVASQVLSQRIVAAGVQEYEIGLRLRLHESDNWLKLDCLGRDEKLVLKPRIGGDKVILLIDLQRMAGVEQQPDLGAFELAGEYIKPPTKATLIKVEPEIDFEAHLFQRRCKIVCIILGIA